MTMCKKINRVVIKIGTSTLTHTSGLFNIRKVEKLIKIISDIKNSGVEVVMVSSGAVGVGAGELNLKEKPADITTKRACAAVGQCKLMYTYDKLFGEYGHIVSQILLSRDIVEEGSRKNHAVNTFNRLIELGAIPIVNENDSIAVDEMVIGDNDSLSAYVGDIVKADLLIILSDIDGLFDGDPKVKPDAKIISHVNAITPDIKALAGDKGSQFGTGGMITKLQAAQTALNAGFEMAIINGNSPELMYDLIEGKSVGTLFSADVR